MRKKSYIFLGIILIILFETLFVLFFDKNNLFHQKELSEEIAAYQAEIDSLKEIIEKRNIIIERLKTDSMYKESILRTRYGMSRQGEKVFQLVEPKSEK